MDNARGLHKTTIVIWSRYPGDKVELVDLAQAATDGDAFCSKQESLFVVDPFVDPDAPSQEFFGDVLEWDTYVETVIALAGSLDLTRAEAEVIANDLAVDDRKRFAGDLTQEAVVEATEALAVRDAERCARLLSND